MFNYAFQSWLDGYRKIFCYKGRERRSAFGFYLLIQFIFLCIVIAIFSGSMFRGMISNIILIAVFIITLITMLPYNVRRLHDSGFSGWYCVIYPVAMGLIVIYSLILKPTSGENKYGPDPKEPKVSSPSSIIS